jgi:murein DD-endopeptidase MepM/ murein hydrolase activator NlpD
MILRRSFLAAAAAFAALPYARAQTSRLSFRGSREQGGLIIGQTAPGAIVTVDDTSVLVSPEGIFTFGLSYNSANPVRVSAVFADGTSEKQEVLAGARQYEIQSIEGLLEKYVEPPPEIAQRLEHERELVWDARKRETGGTDFANPLEWPFPGIVSSRYGNQRILNGVSKSPHLGVDIAAPEGTPIHAAADGIVSISDEFYIEGGFTLLDHGHGVSTCYLHQSERKVQMGQKVSRGEIIGLVGKTGRATGPHCHWGLAWFQVKLDPSRATRTPEPPSPDASPAVAAMPATSIP